MTITTKTVEPGIVPRPRPRPAPTSSARARTAPQGAARAGISAPGSRTKWLLLAGAVALLVLLSLLYGKVLP